jgi:5-methylcytosine-specific restriction endonuclease McrA
MSSYIPNELRQRVLNRAENRCEYCGLAQQGQAATFHVDHVIPVSVGGLTIEENLALACVGCSLYKSAKQQAKDPLSEKFNTALQSPSG